MNEVLEMRRAEEAVEAALRANPDMRRLEPERGFHACFEVPVTRAQVLAHRIRVSHDTGSEEEERERMHAEGDYRVLVGLVLREGGGGELGVATGIDLEFFARPSSGGPGEWLSATRRRDPESGEWVRTADPDSVHRLLHDACPGWNEVVRAEVVRLALARRTGADA